MRERHRLLQRRLPESRLRLPCLHVRQSSVHVRRGLLQPKLRRRQLCSAELNVCDDWQLVHVRRAVLLDALCEQRDVSGLVVLRAAQRCLLGQRGLLHGHVHQDCGAAARYVRGVAARRPGQLRSH
jgi:hypothetical protein